LAQLINSQQQQGWENAYRQSAFAQSVRQAAEQAAEQRRQFEQARAMDAFKTMLQNSLSERGLNLSEREVAAKEGQTDYNEATNAVQQGLLENDQIAKSFPSLSPLRLDRLQQYRNALAAREGEDVTANEGAAKSLNALLTLQRQAKAISDLGSRPSWDWLWKDTQGDWDKAKGTILKGQIPETTQLEPSMLSTWVAERLKSPAYRDRAMWDEEAQRFLPIARPRIFTRNALPAAVPPAAPSGGPFAAGSGIGAGFPAMLTNLLAQAQDAIRRGADPVKVRQRLVEMGLPAESLP
jgi:hypothetical protein